MHSLKLAFIRWACVCVSVYVYSDRSFVLRIKKITLSFLLRSNNFLCLVMLWVTTVTFNKFQLLAVACYAQIKSCLLVQMNLMTSSSKVVNICITNEHRTHHSVLTAREHILWKKIWSIKNNEGLLFLNIPICKRYRMCEHLIPHRKRHHHHHHHHRLKHNQQFMMMVYEIN